MATNDKSGLCERLLPRTNRRRSRPHSHAHHRAFAASKSRSLEFELRNIKKPYHSAIEEQRPAFDPSGLRRRFEYLKMQNE